MEPRRYRVVRKVRESDTITSFYLEAADGRPLDPFEAGQFLTFQVAVPGGERPEIREYSLSSPSQDLDFYRITVKREPPPADQAHLPPGVVSTHLHDAVEVGHELDAYAPRGHFVLDPDSKRPVVLLSGGVGLTPTVSMLHALAAACNREAWFIHACDHGRVHAMADEVRALAAANPRLHVHFCYRFPEAADAGRFHSEGVVTRELLRNLLPLDDYEFYLCGPTPFMQAVYGHLRSLGVRNDRVRFEFFGPATLITEPEKPTAEAPVVVEGSVRRVPATGVAETKPSPAAAAPARGAGPAGDGPLVRFQKSGIEARWVASAVTLLEFAESLGLRPEFSCRVGVCNTCQSRLLSGEVEYIEEPLDMPDEGEALLCCSRPKTDIVLDI
jgi:ferredoxin-NADP reductase/ferredoxin